MLQKKNPSVGNGEPQSTGPARGRRLQHRARMAAGTGLAAWLLVCSLPAAAQSAEALRAAARRALESNPEVSARMHAYLGRIDNQAAAAAGWKPRIDLNATGGANRSTARNAMSQDLKQAGVTLSLTQVLWDGYATQHEVSRASHERLARWFELVETTEQIALESTRATYDVQRQRKLLALAEDNLVQHQQAAGKLESRFKAGVGRGVDLDQANARLALAEVNRDTELANLHDVVARFQRIVGEAPSPAMGAAEMIKGGFPSSASEAAQLALLRGPGIAAGVESLRAAKAGEAARKSSYQPTVSARAQVGGGRNYNGVQDRKTDAGVELLVNWNLYNGGGDTARIREQQQAVNQAMDQRDTACRNARQTALIAYNDADRLSTQLNSLGRNSAAIERARDAYRQQFDIGQRSLLDLLNAENEAYTARRALTNAVYDRAVSYVRTLAATSQLTQQLGLARDMVPADAQNWSAGSDSAGRCPAQPVDVTPFRDATSSAAALPADAAGAAAIARASGLPAAASAAVETAAVQPMRSAAVAALLASAVKGTRPDGRAAALEAAPAGAGVRPVQPMPSSLAATAAGMAAPMAAGMTMTSRLPVGAVAPRASTDVQAVISNRLRGWARAWRNRNLGGISSFYVAGYKGEEASPAAWQTQQRALLAGKGELDMEVEDLQLRDVGDGFVEAHFLQSVTAAAGIEVHNVVQTWRQIDGLWRIVRERKA